MSTVPYIVTYFTHHGARSKTEAVVSLKDLREQILQTQAETKAELPWIKFATFGAVVTAKGSLRHDANVTAVTGCEADYDGEKISFEDAVEKLEKAGVKALVYTSPSHEPDKPRWRVLCPFSQPLKAAEREHMMRRLNGLFDGVLADESFALSQSYYIGHLYEAAEFLAEIVEGQEIDRCDELDRNARGKSNRKAAGNGEDQDGPVDQFDIAKAFELLASGESCHPQVMSILASYAARGVPREALVLMTQNFVGFHQRYHGRLGEMLRMIDWVCTKETKKAQNRPETERQLRGQIPPAAMEPAATPLRIDVADWENKPVPEQEWTVQNRFPRGEIALLSGPGAVGKSLIALHLCVSHVLGRDWLGAMPEQGPAIFVEAEDRTSVLWRRSDALRRHYGTSFTELHDNGLHLFSLHAQNAIMATITKNGLLATTELFSFFRDYALNVRPQLIVLPATANIFTGNENDRSHVSQFIHLLGALADDIDGTVLLITHPSLSGNSRSNGNDHFGLSGSTAWHNGPRARAVLSTTKGDDSSGPDDTRKLEFFKNQYGIADETITLHFADGMLKPENSGTPYEKAAREAAIDSAFMTVFKRLSASGSTIGADRGSRNHPSALFAQEAEIKAARCSKRELIEAATRLVDKGTLRVETYGYSSNQHKKLVVP